MGTKGLILVWLTATALAACGDDSATPEDAGEDAGGGSDGGPQDNGVRFDETFDGTCGAPRCASEQTETACSCVLTPRSEDVFAINQVGCSQLDASGEGEPRNPDDDSCVAGAGDTPTDLGCFMPGSYRQPGQPETVTMYGVVDVFGNGGDANNITVEVYEEGADANLGALLGMTEAVLDVDAAVPCFETEVQIEDNMPTGTRRLAFYQITGIPTETPLIVKTSGDPNFWKSIYTYNLLLENDEVETDAPVGACDGFPTGARVEYRARILSVSDWFTIPTLAGLPAGIDSDKGALAGEVHDCGDVRIEYAQVGTIPGADVLTYFNDNPDNPLPELSRLFDGTSRLGLYAALNIAEGPVDVAALGRTAEGDLVSLGWYRARIYANAITSVTLRGLRASQTGN